MDGRIGLADRLTVGVAARLSRYLQVLTQAKKMGKDRISSQEISDYTNINATQIRRDLSGSASSASAASATTSTRCSARSARSCARQGQHNIALVGAGRLGQAIASSPIFAEHGINIAAVLDTDPDKTGHAIGEPQRAAVREPARRRCARTTSSSACSPCRRTSAQQAADDLIDAGVKIIFNYSEALLDVPGDVAVHTSNPAVELLYALYFHLT